MSRTGIPLRSDPENDAILESVAFQDLSRSLKPEELERIFADEILRALAPEGKAEKPRLEVFYGQPGSGKTTQMRAAAKMAGEPVAAVDPDELKDYLPGFEAAAKISPQRARDRAEARSADLAARLAEYGLRHGAVVMVEASHPDQVERYAELAERNGVPATLNVMAVDRQTSYLRVLERYDRALQAETAGNCGIMSKKEHDAAYDVTASAVHRLETDKRFDRITVIGADGTHVYDNDLSGIRGDRERQWPAPARAVETLIETRNAPWSEEYRRQILRTSDRVHESRRLKADDFGKTLPFPNYKLELRKTVNERGEFDPENVTPKTTANVTALNAERYLIRVKEELLYSMKANREADVARRDDFVRRISGFDRGVEARVDDALERAGVEKDPLGSLASRDRKRTGRTVHLNSQEAAAMERLIAGAAARGDVRDGQSRQARKRQRRESFDLVDSDTEAELIRISDDFEASRRNGAADAKQPSKRQRRDSLESLDSATEADMLQLLQDVEAGLEPGKTPDREEDPTRSPGDMVDAIGDAFDEERKRAGRDAATRRGLDSNGRDGRSL